MSGRDAIRGFTIQALLCLLDALESDDWTSVAIEPDSASEKVDIVWRTSKGRKAQQVKSSRNRIGRAAVMKWCMELAASGEADSYELRLAGPVAEAALDGAPFHGVEVPMPAFVDTLALIEQAVTKLDRYLTKRDIDPVPLAVRESLVALVSGHLLDGSVRGHVWSRAEFDGLLLRWVTGSYPQAIAYRLHANCEVLWTSMVFVAPRLREPAEVFGLVLPITVVNGGPGVSVVEWCAVRVTRPDGRLMLYKPVATLPVGNGIDRTSYAKRSLDRAPAFEAFAVLPNASREVHVLFDASARPGYAIGLWPSGTHRATLHLKFRGLAEPRVFEAPTFERTNDHIEAIRGEEGRQIGFATAGLDEYLDGLGGPD